jgi:DnaJ-class molecular chaperone
MAGSDEDGPTQAPAGGGQLNPGDDAPPGTPGTGEDVCPDCTGSGRVQGRPCEACGGTGVVIKGIAGG